MAKTKKVSKIKKMPKHKDELGYTAFELAKFMTKKELKQFYEWMYGQTCGISNGEVIYYAWDVERFLNLIRKGIPTYWD